MKIKNTTADSIFFGTELAESKGVVLLAGKNDSDDALTFALDIARKVASRKTPVAIFSAEKSDAQIYDRLLSAWAGIPDGQHITDVQPAQWDMLSTIMSRLAEFPVFIDDTASTVPGIASKIGRFNRYNLTDNIALAVVDNIRLLCADGQTQQDVISELENMAIELNLSVIALTTA